MRHISALLLLCIVGYAYGFGSGNITDRYPAVCKTLAPSHNVPPSTLSTPYEINTESTTYKAGQKIKVSIAVKANFTADPQKNNTVFISDFEGILMQVRKVKDDKITDEMVGTFEENDDNLALYTCKAADNSKDNTLAHFNPGKGHEHHKPKVLGTWTAPADLTGDVRVVATVARRKVLYWLKIESATLKKDDGGSTSASTSSTACMAFVAMLATTVAMLR